MRPLLPITLVFALIGAGCGDDAGEFVADDSPTSSVAAPTTAPGATTTPPSSARSSSTPSSSTRPPSVTVLLDGDDPYASALEVLGMQWSTLEIWGDGWVEIVAKATGSPTLDRDSEIGRLFSDDVHDAIEAAGATDMLAAYEAVSSAGLVSEVLAVFAEHPEARDAVLGGPATIANTVATTDDGVTWSTRPIGHLAPGELRASASVGDRLALVLGERDEMTLRLATTLDLDTWTVVSIPMPFTVGIGAYDVAALPEGWLLTVFDIGKAHAAAAWIVSEDGTATETTLPGGERCCRTEATSAGVFAYVGDFGEASSAWFSGDGISWERREIPVGQRVTGAASVRDGVVISTRDDDAAVTTQWWATPEGEDWTVTELPDEIEWEISVFDNNHEGVAQFVAVPGWGQRGYQPPIPTVEFAVESGGRRFDFVIGESDVDESFAVTVTDLDTAAVIFDRAGPLGGPLPSWARADGTELQFLDADDQQVTVAPLAAVEEAYGVARAEVENAAAESRTPTEEAFLTSTYLLYSFDGIAWWSTIVEPSGESFSPWFAASINGSRGLMGDGDGGHRVVELAEG